MMYVEFPFCLFHISWSADLLIAELYSQMLCFLTEIR